MSTENYVREALRLFANDPPDSAYQHGFLDAIVGMATESLGFKRSDPDIAAAMSANKFDQASDLKVAPLRFGETKPS